MSRKKKTPTADVAGRRGRKREDGTYRPLTQPLTYVQRHARYLAQNGGKRLTVRQVRQLRKCATRQLAREARS